MNLRFPAPSSDDAIASARSLAGGTPVINSSGLAQSSSPEVRSSVPSGGADVPTMTSVVPVYQVPISLSQEPKAHDKQDGVREASLAPPLIPRNPVERNQTETTSTNQPADGPTNPIDPAGAAPATTAPAPKVPKLRPRKRQRVRLRHLLPAWSVSLFVHVVILTARCGNIHREGRDQEAGQF